MWDAPFSSSPPSLLWSFLSRNFSKERLGRQHGKDDTCDKCEYEILLLLNGDCRERLHAYEKEGKMEAEVRLLQYLVLDPRVRVACQLQLEEKRVL